MCTHLTSISGYAFYKCSKCSEIILPKSLTTLEISVFCETGILNITIPASLTIIPENCFRKSTKLSNLIIPEDSQLTTISRWAIVYTNISTIKIPASVINIASDALEYSALTSISVNDSNPKYYVENGMLINRNTLSIIAYPTFMQGDVLNIPEGIKNAATHSCRNGLYKYINFPSSLTIIEGYCFGGSSLVELNLPDTITFIGPFAFHLCVNLTKIKLPSHVINLPESCFNGVNISSIDLPNTLKSIGQSCFLNCVNLLEITLPANLSSLGGKVFSSWTVIKFAGDSMYLDSQYLIMDKTNKTVFQYLGSDENANINIPAAVEVIGNSCFEDKTSIVSVTFQTGSVLNTIKNKAFYNYKQSSNLTRNNRTICIL